MKIFDCIIIVDGYCESMACVLYFCFRVIEILKLAKLIYKQAKILNPKSNQALKHILLPNKAPRRWGKVVEGKHNLIISPDILFPSVAYKLFAFDIIMCHYPCYHENLIW